MFYSSRPFKDEAEAKKWVKALRFLFGDAIVARSDGAAVVWLFRNEGEWKRANNIDEFYQREMDRLTGDFFNGGDEDESA